MEVDKQIKTEIKKALKECGVNEYYEPSELIHTFNNDERTESRPELLIDDKTVDILSKKGKLDDFKNNLEGKGFVVVNLLKVCRPLR